MVVVGVVVLVVCVCMRVFVERSCPKTKPWEGKPVAA